jgi:hypothetical protein
VIARDRVIGSRTQAVLPIIGSPDHGDHQILKLLLDCQLPPD